MWHVRRIILAGNVQRDRRDESVHIWLCAHVYVEFKYYRVCVCGCVLSRVPQFLPASWGEQHGLDVSHRREVQQHVHVFIPRKLF